MTSSITLALPSKGAIAEPTINFLRECGLPVSKPNDRQYVGTIPALHSTKVLFQRATDVIYKVIDGTAQIGITGLDIVLENPHQDVVIVHEKLGYGHCSLVVAVPEMWVDVENMLDIEEVALDFRENKGRNLRIATKYPTLSRQFLYSQGIHHFTLVKAEGAIEAAPTLGYADIIIDLTQTGTTLRENHLKWFTDGIIIDSQACLIGNRNALMSNPAVLENLHVILEHIDAAMQGRAYYQIVANIRGDSPQAVAALAAANPATNGLQGPTIAPIYAASDNGSDAPQWYTITIIIKSKQLLQAVE
ncbi:MAG: ATP phosphoribosyltransferase, partial [Anaerolineae bacterium]|nr:ATP phosphoribosyltransferase [Anaerolineae bacterium]